MKSRTFSCWVTFTVDTGAGVTVEVGLLRMEEETALGLKTTGFGAGVDCLSFGFATKSSSNDSSSSSPLLIDFEEACLALIK